MLAASSLSVEVWQKILRYAISVHDFLDPSAFEGVLSNFELTNPQCDRNNEFAYWRAERHRNVLQRVCKSWDTYLRPFEHRYVRMVDIWHDKIPFSAIEKAVRLSFDKCNCKTRHSWRLANHLDQRMDRNSAGVQGGQSGRPDTYLAYSSSFTSLERLEIVDFRDLHYVKDALIQLSDHATHLKTILERVHLSQVDLTNTKWIINEFPELLQYYGQGPYWTFGTFPYEQEVVEFNGETLSLLHNFYIMQRDPPLGWKFPNLRYLRIDYACVSGSVPFVNDVYPLLHAVGVNLHSLHLNCFVRRGHIPAQIPAELWGWCPKLEKLATTMELVVPPLISHPFHTFIATAESLSRITPDFLDWPNVRTITVDWTWDNTRTENHIPSRWRREYTDKVIRIEDQNGLTWRESVELASRVSNLDLGSLISQTSPLAGILYVEARHRTVPEAWRFPYLTPMLTWYCWIVKILAMQIRREYRS